MGKNIPRPKGIRTPYFLATILGFIDRKTKSAGIDPETKRLTSGWIIRKQRQFSAYLNRMKEALENAARTIQTEADCLLNELVYLPTSVPATPQMSTDSRGEGPEARAAAREWKTGDGSLSYNYLRISLSDFSKKPCNLKQIRSGQRTVPCPLENRPLQILHRIL